jgi:hypothetical protein
LNIRSSLESRYKIKKNQQLKHPLKVISLNWWTFDIYRFWLLTPVRESRSYSQKLGLHKQLVTSND